MSELPERIVLSASLWADLIGVGGSCVIDQTIDLPKFCFHRSDHSLPILDIANILLIEVNFALRGGSQCLTTSNIDVGDCNLCTFVGEADGNTCTVAGATSYCPSISL